MHRDKSFNIPFCWKHGSVSGYNKQTYISFFGKILNCKRNVRLKIVASGCNQCVWAVGVVAGHGHWVGH